MELLAFTHVAIDYESSDPLSADVEISLKAPKVSWLGLMAAIATLVTSNIAPALALQLGDAGLNVEQLQIALQGRSLYTGGINGFYGTRTEAAVRTFQRENDLPVTGIADTETLSLLGLDSGFVSQPVTPVRRPVQATIVRPVVIENPVVVQRPIYTTNLTNQGFFGTSASLVNNRAIARGVVQTAEGFGINVRSGPGGQIIGGEPDGAVVSYNPASTVTSGGYTWVQTTSGGWVASNYLRGGYDRPVFY